MNKFALSFILFVTFIIIEISTMATSKEVEFLSIGITYSCTGETPSSAKVNLPIRLDDPIQTYGKREVCTDERFNINKIHINSIGVVKHKVLDLYATHIDIDSKDYEIMKSKLRKDKKLKSYLTINSEIYSYNVLNEITDEKMYISCGTSDDCRSTALKFAK